jgi:ceramide glucosyltransferase
VSLAVAVGAVVAAWGVAALATAVAAAVLALHARAAARTRRVEATHADCGAASARVVVLRPIAGRDPRLEDALVSSAAIETRHCVRVEHAVARADDPAWPVVVACAARVGGEARLLPTRSANQKAGLLAGLVAGAPDADVYVVADGDVDLAGDVVDALVSPLVASPGAAGAAPRALGATWAAGVELGAAGGDRWSAAILHSSFHAFAVLGALDPRGLVGKAFAIRADALRAIGGFDAVADLLGEDMAIAARLRAHGFDTRFVGRTVPSLASGRTVGAVIARFGRWLWVIRAQRAGLLASYPLLFFPALLVLPTLAVAAAAGAISPLAALALAGPFVLARLLVGLVARRASGVPLDAGWPGDLVRAELGMAAAFAVALTRREVEWRGRRLRFAHDGRIVLVEANPPRVPPRPEVRHEDAA